MVVGDAGGAMAHTKGTKILNVMRGRGVGYVLNRLYLAEPTTTIEY
jgi:hypothetical protein